ncbi:MAG: hypothetical protein ACAH10_04005 [Methylophilaceae bacterium]
MTNEEDFDQKLYRLIKEFQKAGSEFEDQRNARKERQKIREELYLLVGSRNQPQQTSKEA